MLLFLLFFYIYFVIEEDGLVGFGCYFVIFLFFFFRYWDFDLLFLG